MEEKTTKRKSGKRVVRGKEVRRRAEFDIHQAFGWEMAKHHKAIILVRDEETSGYEIQVDAGNIISAGGIGVVLPSPDGSGIFLSNEAKISPDIDVYDIYHEKSLKPQYIVDNKPLTGNSKMDFVEIAQEGVSAATVKKLIQIFRVKQSAISNLLRMTDKTLREKMNTDALLDADQSIKVLKLFTLFLYGSEVLEGSENFLKWIRKPSFGLRKKIPAELLTTSDGIDLVTSELRSLEFGDMG